MATLTVPLTGTPTAAVFPLGSRRPAMPLTSERWGIAQCVRHLQRW